MKIGSHIFSLCQLLMRKLVLKTLGLWGRKAPFDQVSVYQALTRVRTVDVCAIKYHVSPNLNICWTPHYRGAFPKKPVSKLYWVH